METIIINKTKENKQDFEDLRWCLLANNPKSINEKVRGILIKDGLVVATDGFRLHLILNNLNIKNGYYEVNSNKVNQIVISKNDSPHYDFLSICPEWKPRNYIPCYVNNSLFFREIYHNFFYPEIVWDTNYVRDAWMDNSIISVSKESSPYTPLCIYDNDRRGAIIMPRTIIV